MRAVPYRHEDGSEIDQPAARFRRRELRELPLASERLYQLEARRLRGRCYDRLDRDLPRLPFGRRNGHELESPWLPGCLDGRPRAWRSGPAHIWNHPL